MSSILKKYLKGNRTLWAVYFALCLVSVIEQYSASSSLAFSASSYSAPMLSHIGFLVGGIILVFFIHRFVSLEVFCFLGYCGLAFSIVCLTICDLHLTQLGAVGIRGAWRWVKFGPLPQFQPSDLAKLSLVIVVAYLLSLIKNPKTDEKRYFGWILGLTGVTTMLILRENGSTAMLLGTVVFLMLCVAGISWKKLVLLFLAVAGGFLLLVLILPDNNSILPRAGEWRARTATYLHKNEETASNKSKTANFYEINDKNRQEKHGEIAVARGFPLGKLPGRSVERNVLPDAYTDFIFAIICEEMGLWGVIPIILMYLTLIFTAGYGAAKSTQNCPAIMIIGLALIVSIQAFLSMAVATGLFPVTGQALPLISHGGTSILVTSTYFGIIIGITRQIQEKENPPVQDIETI